MTDKGKGSPSNNAGKAAPKQGPRDIITNSEKSLSNANLTQALKTKPGSKGQNG